MGQANFIFDNLKSEGHKMTKVRKAIIEILTSHSQPFSASDILSELAVKGLRVNKTTVYRELLFLKEQSVVGEIELGEGKKRYEITPKDHHHHLVCVSCKSIKDIPLERDLDTQEEHIAQKNKFKILNHSLEFFGLCGNCQ